MDAIWKSVDRCRICGNADLVTVWDMGSLALTGIFPDNSVGPAEVAPQRLVKCVGNGACGLVQLADSVIPEIMFGENYGYRSGLNDSMVSHLRELTTYATAFFPDSTPTSVLDVGSNDGTTLSFFRGSKIRVGVDPTAPNFSQYYDGEITVIPDFFSSSKVNSYFPGLNLELILSISMFYDLEEPVTFARNIRELLSKDGIWITEQSYLGLMIDAGSFDTICHEHLEYYSLQQMQVIAKLADLKIIDVSLNSANGGSFRVVFARKDSTRLPSNSVGDFIRAEEARGLNSMETLSKFVAQCKDAIEVIHRELVKIKENGKSIGALGASTKGNVLLQMAKLDTSIITNVYEVNPFKYNRYTPGTNIEIVPESELMGYSPDYLLVLPWHFSNYFKANREKFLSNLIFPLPKFEIY